MKNVSKLENITNAVTTTANGKTNKKVAKLKHIQTATEETHPKASYSIPNFVATRRH